MEPIILASTSPRRQEILRSLGIPFSVMSPPYDEINPDNAEPSAIAELHAVKKVESIIRLPLKINIPWILGADTVVSCDDVAYGKPQNRDEAKAMIKTFSGRTHQVYTAICLYSSALNHVSSRISCSQVTFMDLDDAQIELYLNTGEWQGVAGGYRIQSLASCYITSITGSYSGIVGLPIHELYAILREHGYPFAI